MPTKGDEFQAKALADKMAREQEMGFAPSNADFNALISIVEQASKDVGAKLRELESRRETISIADMFDMQMSMNHLSQLSEMSTSIVSASNSAIMSMARNVKG